MQHTQGAEWQVKEGIGIITISNPPGNYLHEPEFVPLPRLKTWTADPDLKGILIHGKGKHFSAGGDLQRLFELATGTEPLEGYLLAGTRLIDHLIELDLPLAAAIRGACFGAGLELALACHIRIAAENALFASPETNHGIIPGLGGTFRLPHAVGQANALRLILSGDLINAEEARAIGLIDTIVPRSDLLNHAFDLLRRMTGSLSVKVIRSVVRTLRNATVMKAEEAIAEENRLFCELATEEARRRLSESEKGREDR